LEEDPVTEPEPEVKKDEYPIQFKTPRCCPACGFYQVENHHWHGTDQTPVEGMKCTEACAGFAEKFGVKCFECGTCGCHFSLHGYY
jgi:hypothetical protein